MENKVFQTGTTTLGIVCKDGIVLSADKKMTLGGQIVSNTKFDKVVIVNDSLALTTAGLVSDVQLLVKIIKAQIRLDELRRGRRIRVKEAANLLANLVYNNVRKMSMVQGITGFLVGGKDSQGFYLYDLGIDGALSLYDNYACDGSGMMFALGVLENNYREGMSVEEGIKLAQDAITSAMKRDTASGGGIDIVTITSEGTKKVSTKLVEEKLR